jgi:hypothetical protein
MSSALTSRRRLRRRASSRTGFVSSASWRTAIASICPSTVLAFLALAGWLDAMVFKNRSRRLMLAASTKRSRPSAGRILVRRLVSYRSRVCGKTPSSAFSASHSCASRSRRIAPVISTSRAADWSRSPPPHINCHSKGTRETRKRLLERQQQRPTRAQQRQHLLQRTLGRQPDSRQRPPLATRWDSAHCHQSKIHAARPVSSASMPIAQRDHPPFGRNLPAHHHHSAETTAGDPTRAFLQLNATLQTSQAPAHRPHGEPEAVGSNLTARTGSRP